jgi:hypothetical protein
LFDGGRHVRLDHVFWSDGVIIAAATATSGGRSIVGVAAGGVIIVHQRAAWFARRLP